MKKKRISRLVLTCLFALTSLLSVNGSIIPNTPPSGDMPPATGQSTTASPANLMGKAGGPGALYVNTVCVELHALLCDSLFVGGKPDTHAGMYIDWETESLTIAVTDLQAVDSYGAILNERIDDIVKAAFASADPALAAQYSDHKFVRFIQQPYSLNYLNQIKRDLSQKMDSLSLSYISVSQKNNCVEVVVDTTKHNALNRYLVENHYVNEKAIANSSSISHPPIQVSEGFVAIQPTAINAYSGTAISNDFGYSGTIGFNATDRITGQKGVVTSYH